MYKITFIENSSPKTIEVIHGTDLSKIGHNSIICEEKGLLALNDKDHKLFYADDSRVSSVKAILAEADCVNESYFDLMVSGDIAGAFKAQNN